MASQADLISMRDQLIAARLTGTRMIHDADGSEVQYKSDTEMAQALAYVEGLLSAASPPVKTIRFQHQRTMAMLNFVSHGNTATVPASPRAVSGGDGLLVGSMFGIAVNDTALNAECVLQLAGVYAMPKVAAGVIGQGCASIGMTQTTSSRSPRPATR